MEAPLAFQLPSTMLHRQHLAPAPWQQRQLKSVGLAVQETPFDPAWISVTELATFRGRLWDGPGSSQEDSRMAASVELARHARPYCCLKAVGVAPPPLPPTMAANSEHAGLPGPGAFHTAASEASSCGTEVSEVSGDAPTVGSMGHPSFCGLACKYARKPRGCKDGAFCDRCHLCPWVARRAGAKV